MPAISPLTHKLIKDLYRSKRSSQIKGPGPFIEVKHVAPKANNFQRKIKERISKKDESLIKRRSIEKILQRDFFPEEKAGKKISDASSEKFIKELISLGHLQNKTIDSSKKEEIKEVLQKYSQILKGFPRKDKVKKSSFTKWVVSLAACEIEEKLSPEKENKALLFYMFHSIKKSVEIQGKIKEEKKETLLYIAVQQALFNFEKPVIYHNLLQLKYPEKESFNKEDFRENGKELYKEKKEIDRLLKHSLLKKLYHFCRLHCIPFLVAGDVISENPKKASEFLLDPEETEKKIITHYENRAYAKRKRALRALKYSIILMFLLSVISFFASEIPITAQGENGDFSLLSFTFILFCPTLLITFLSLPIKMPPKKNKKRIVLRTMEIIYKKEKRDVYNLQGKTSPKTFSLFSFLYLLLFVLFIGIIAFLLQKTSISPLSSFLFILFLPLISFLTVKIKKEAKDLWMVKRKNTPWFFLVDIFAFPLLYIEKRFTKKKEKQSTFYVFLNIFLDTPFSVFTEMLSDYRSYLREKKEGLY